jgi:hypothetical protein
VTVELTFDLVLDLKFLVTGQLPLSLKRVIGEQKNQIHASLSPDPDFPRRLVGSRIFKLNGGDTFLVYFVSDLRHPSSELQPLRVTHIEKL